MKGLMFGLLLSMCVCFSCREHGKAGRVVVPDSMMTLQEIDSDNYAKFCLARLFHENWGVDSDVVLAYNFFPIYGEHGTDSFWTNHEDWDDIENSIVSAQHEGLTLNEAKYWDEYIEGGFAEYHRGAPKDTVVIVNHYKYVFIKDE